jgi:dUTPase
MSLTLKIFVQKEGSAPTRGKEGDAGLDCFARVAADADNGDGRHYSIDVLEGAIAKIPLGFSYAFWENGVVSHNFWLEIKNRSGVGTNSGFVTVAEVGDANYRGEIHYCVAKVTPGKYSVKHGAKIAQALIHPFVDPYMVKIEVVSSIEELGPSARGVTGFGSSGQ